MAQTRDARRIGLRKAGIACLKCVLVAACLVPIIEVTLLGGWWAAGLLSRANAARYKRLLETRIEVVKPTMTAQRVEELLGRPEKVYDPQEAGHGFPLARCTWDGWKPAGPVWVYRESKAGASAYVYFGNNGKVHHVWVADCIRDD